MFVTDTLGLKMRNFIKNEEKRSLRNRQKVEVNGQIKNNSGHRHMQNRYRIQLRILSDSKLKLAKYPYLSRHYLPILPGRWAAI